MLAGLRGAIAGTWTWLPGPDVTAPSPACPGPWMEVTLLSSQALGVPGSEGASSQGGASRAWSKGVTRLDPSLPGPTPSACPQQEAAVLEVPLPWPASCCPLPAAGPDGAGPRQAGLPRAPAPSPPCWRDEEGQAGRQMVAQEGGCPGRRADCQDRWWARQGSGARPICSRPLVGLSSSTWGYVGMRPRDGFSPGLLVSCWVLPAPGAQGWVFPVLSIWGLRDPSLVNTARARRAGGIPEDPGRLDVVRGTPQDQSHPHQTRRHGAAPGTGRWQAEPVPSCHQRPA